MSAGLGGCKALDQVSSQPKFEFTNLSFTLYKSPTCGCCTLYVDYLNKNDVSVEIAKVSDPEKIKLELGIPESLWSCHTMLLQNYYIEGHVPLAAINELLKTKPDIDGIALPGMPVGSPGMGGEQKEPFVIYAIKTGEVQEFLQI